MNNQPPVIILMADQLRADFIGELTPNISALMEESVVFDRAYCASPISVPARGAFFTGQYPNRTGCLINGWKAEDKRHGQVRAGTPNLYSLLESQWDSHNVGKQHFKVEGGIENDSQTVWDDSGKHYNDLLRAHKKPKPGGPRFRGLMPEMRGGKSTFLTNYSIPTTGCYPHGYDHFFDGFFTNRALAAIKDRDKSKPLALNMMFLAPHPPLEIPQPWYSQVPSMDLPENVGRWSEGQSPLQLYNLPGYLGTRYTRHDWKEPWRVYAGLVALLDYCIGQILDTLKEEGIYDDAIILFTADHGEMLGSHCLWQKMCMYEESSHVPLSIRLPQGQQGGRHSQELVSHVDVLPTLCELLNLETPPDLSGISLAPHLREDVPLQRDPLFIQYDGNGALGNFQRCLVQNQYKLIVDIFKDEIFFELYDVLADPQEDNNLAFQEEPTVREMLSLLIAQMQKDGDAITLTADSYEQFLRERS